MSNTRAEVFRYYTDSTNDPESSEPGRRRGNHLQLLHRLVRTRLNSFQGDKRFNSLQIIIRVAGDYSATVQVPGQHKLPLHQPLHQRRSLRLSVREQVLIVIGLVPVELVREVAVQVYALRVVAAGELGQRLAITFL